MTRFGEYRALAQQMVSIAPDKPEYRLEVVYANNNLGTALMDERRYRAAANVFRASVSAAELLASGAPRNFDYQKQLVNCLSWLADAHEYSGALDQALGEHERQLRLLDDLKQIDPRDTEIDRYAMTAHRTAGRLLASRGDATAGLKELRASVAISDILFKVEPDNTEWLQANAAGRYDLARLQLATGDLAGAGNTARAGCDIADRLLQRDSSVADWKAQLRVKCLNLRARIAIASGAASEAFELARQSLSAAQTTPRVVEQRLLVFDARAVGGIALAASGNKADATSWWRSAESNLPRSIELRPVEMEQLAGIEKSLGNEAEASRLASALSAMGYRYPGSIRAH